MSMDVVNDAQTVNLVGLEQGQFMNVVITGATAGGNATLEFKNGGDSGWSADPTFNGTVTGGVLNERVKCLSAHTRITFASDPAGTPYRITLVWDSVPTF